MKTNQPQPTGRSLFNVVLAVVLFLAAAGTGVAQPIITQQPQNHTNAVGTTATFTVEATGTGPLAYQWQRDTGFGDFYDFAGCTDASLSLTNVGASDAVNYRVILTNAQSAVTTAVAHLYVVRKARAHLQSILQQRSTE